MLGLHAGNHFSLDRLAVVGLDVENLATVTQLGKGDGQAITPCTTGAANAVGVVLSLHGQAEVEHVGDGGHVNAACGHIGGHQDLHLTLAQRHQAAVAQALAQGTVQGHSVKAVLLQVIGQAVTLNLGAGKHNGLVDGGVTQPMVKQLALVLGVVGPEQHLLDVGVLFLRAINLHLLGRRAVVTHHAHGQLLNTRRKRGAEHHGLAALNGELVDFGQIVGETEVQHAVGFIHHQELNLVEFDLHGALQIQQAARCGNHEIGVLQLGNLQLVRHTAHHAGHAQATAMLDQVNRIVRNLLGEFTRGAQNQRARGGCFEVACIGGVFALGALRGWLAFGGSVGHRLFKVGALFGFCVGILLEQGVQDWQQEGCRLAATRLAGHHQVDEFLGRIALDDSRQSHGDDLRLHSGRLGVAQIDTSLDQLRGQTNGDEAVGQGHFRLGCDIGGDVGRDIGRNRKGINRRKVARHVKSVGHLFTHTRAPQHSAVAPSMVKKHQPSNEACTD